MDETTLIYLAVKGAAYIAWCGQGARIHGHADRLALKAFVYGILRFAMGAILGLFLIFSLVNMLAGLRSAPLALYLAVYVPVRWLEWSLLAVIMDQDRRTTRNLLIGEGSASRLWRLGGIVISCLADIPIILSVGFPIGRFLC